MTFDSKDEDGWPDNTKISVWWHYESCQVPKYADGGLIVNNIIIALKNLRLYGPIKFSVYGNEKMIPESVIESMHKTGITTIYEPEGSNLQIIGDMWLWALRNPPRATYVLIYEDQDFSHSVSRLSGLGYKIILARPDNRCSSLHWSWTDICQGTSAVKSVTGNLFNHRSQMQEQRNRFPLDDNRPSYKSPTGEEGSYSSLEDLKDKVLSVAMDQHGSQFLCQQIEKQTTEDTEAIFSEVKDRVCLLMFDQFGRHVVKELFLNCRKEKLRYLVSSVTADFHLFKALCLHSQGSHFLMELLYSDLMTQEEIAHMISALKEIAIRLLKDEIGARLIQYCFHIFSEKDTKPIFDVIVSNCRQIATNQSGCCFLQDLLSEGMVTPTEKRLVAAIMENLFDLSINQFGNYLVQHLIGIGSASLTAAMVGVLTRKFDYLSMDKYGIHVVERLMEASEIEHSSQIIDEIVSSPDCSRAMLSRLVQSARNTGKRNEQHKEPLASTLDHFA
ncbi:pumilio homolog 12-like [Primulina eburnea]|uniref:pumilio homolog 12-like n=1 Tax=Primulina eburnea TaxID=1245227 RepID=UPI003C6CB992